MVKFMKVLLGVIEWVIVILFIFFAVMCFIQVIARYVLNNSIMWAEEFARYTFIWALMFGCAIAVGRNSHMSVDLILDIIPKKIHRMYKFIIDILILLFFCYMMYASIELIINVEGQISPAMRVSMQLVYLCFPIGFGLMLIFGIDRLLKEINVDKDVGSNVNTFIQIEEDVSS